jgi:hypothetical protein
MHSQKPFLLSQSFLDMPAITRWSQPSYFGQFSSQPIEIEVSPHDSPGYGERQEASLGEFLALLEHNTPFRVYMAQFPLTERIPELKEDLSSQIADKVLRSGEVYSSSTWIGRRSLTPLHHDPRALTNLFIQICGEKEFRLFDPEKVEKRKLKVGAGTMGNTSSVDVWREDFGEEGVEGTVRAGDGVVIPRGWWHSVRSRRDTINMSVNWWFKLDDMA